MLAGENLNDMLAKVLPVMNFLQNYLLLIFFFIGHVGVGKQVVHGKYLSLQY